MAETYELPKVINIVVRIENIRQYPLNSDVAYSGPDGADGEQRGSTEDEIILAVQEGLAAKNIFADVTREEEE